MRCPAHALFAAACLLLLTGCAVVDALVIDDPRPEFGDPARTGQLIVDCQVRVNLASSLGDVLEDALSEALLLTSDNAGMSGGLLRNEAGEEIVGTPTGFARNGQHNLVVFSSLPPGAYRLMRVTADFDLSGNQLKNHYGCGDSRDSSCPGQLELTYVLPGFVDGDFDFEIAAGEVVYLGKLLVSEKHVPPYRNLVTINSGWEGDKRWEIEKDTHLCRPEGRAVLEYGAEHEAAAMKLLLGKYQENPWRSQWQARLAATENREG